MKLLTITFSVGLFFAQMFCPLSGVFALPNPGVSEKRIKIGLLIPDPKSTEAIHGAEMAIRKANAKAGSDHRSFQLVTRSMEGPWGTGSKEAVDLIFKEKVWAILGSHDGRNAHLVEQVCAKSRVVFLSAWASDPTLSQAFVPSYFSCVPTDLQQADALIKEIYIKRKLNKIAIVSDNGYDAKQALGSFLKKIKLAGKAVPLQLFYDNSVKDFKNLFDQVNKSDINGIVIFGHPSDSRKLIQQIRQQKMGLSIFGSLSLLDGNEFSNEDPKDYEHLLLVYPENLAGSKGLAFQNEFQRIYGKMPGVVAAYAYDGMSLILEAARNADFDRGKIQKALSMINLKGVTGVIQFDDRGNRAGPVGLVEIKNGIPVPVGE